MAGEESNAPDGRTTPTKGDAAPTRGDAKPPKSLADQSTFPASERNQETPASGVVQSSAPPDFIDHFEIRRVLGHGGFGSVFLAHDTKLDRMVALKLLDKLDRQAARRMLDHETQAASKLRHPHLVTVFQSGEHPRGYYIVFEHILGPDQRHARSLREVLSEKKSLPSAEAVSIALHVAEALAHAHEADVVHRDIKPENILLDYKGTAFLADFGCARRRRRHTAGVRSVVGTFPYMSVEQIEGRWNAQTDIWSLGVVLSEMLRGTRPFAFAEKTKSRRASEAAYSFAAAIVGLEQLPSIPGVDVDLNAICRKCLQKDPGHRYGSASALAADLRRWQRNEPVSCRRVGVIEQTRRWAQRNPLVATLLTALVLILAIGFGGSSYFAVQMWTARQRYVDEQLTQLDQLDGPTFNAVIANLQSEPFQQMAIQSLSSRWHDQASTDSKHLRNRLAAAIVTMQRAETETKPDSTLVDAARECLLAALLTAETADEFLLIRGHAVATGDPQASDNDKLTRFLWATAQDASNPGSQFRALSALAEYDPGGAAWTDLATTLVQRLLDQEDEQIADWASNVAGLADRLVPILKAKLNDGNETRKGRAAIAYATLANTPLELAKRIVTEPSPGVVRELWLQLKSRIASPQQALQLLDQLDAPPIDATARQLANLSVCRLSLCGSDLPDELPMFQHDDPQARYLFEKDAAEYGVVPSTLLNWIDKLQSDGSKVEAIQTALLAMGSTDVAQLPAHTRQPIVNRVSSIYREHESAQVHAAAARVLRQWNMQLPKIDKPRHDGDDSWRINKLGQLMVRVALPDDVPAEVNAYEITLGDYAAYVRSRAAHYGPDHRVLSWIREPIKRHLNETGELLSGALTAAAHAEDKLLKQQLQLPVRHITALQSVAYCTWASQQEGLADDQQAFRVRDDLQKEHESLLEAMERQIGPYSSPLQTCARNARGYRLPFSDEWEFLFADPSLLSLADDDLRDELGWYWGNAELEIQPVGGKRPHRLGVYDAWGNVTEWCIYSPRETHLPFESLGSSYESKLGDMRPLKPGIEIYGGHRAIGFRMLRMLD